MTSWASARARAHSRKGLSLIEVVVALGIASFALLSLAVLLPAGMKTNQATSEETRAADLLTAVEADLRNSAESGGRSRLFGLASPYVRDASGRLVFNTSLPGSSSLVEGQTTVGLKGDETVAPLRSLPRFQIAVFYVQVPAAGSLQPIQARLVADWPCRNATDAKSFAGIPKAGGRVETYVTFPAP